MAVAGCTITVAGRQRGPHTPHKQDVCVAGAGTQKQRMMALGRGPGHGGEAGPCSVLPAVGRCRGCSGPLATIFVWRDLELAV